MLVLATKAAYKYRSGEGVSHPQRRLGNSSTRMQDANVNSALADYRRKHNATRTLETAVPAIRHWL